MDYKERMEQMRLEIEKRRREMEERLNRHRISEPHTINKEKPTDENFSLRMLAHLPGLEDASETKLGNFERLVPTYFPKLTSSKEIFSSFGYSDNDLSAIVNPLSSLVEIEFIALLKDHLQEWGLIEEGRKNPTIGSLSKVYSSKNKEARAFMEQVLKSAGDKIDIERSRKQYDEIWDKRNGTSHTKTISLQGFLKFYNDIYYPFFHETIKAIAAYKKKRKDDKSGFSSFSSTFSGRKYMQFSSEVYQKQLSELFDDTCNYSVKPQICILFTDLDKLALKYCQEINQVDEANQRIISYPQFIYNEIFVPFCRQGAESGITYILLNVADPAYSRILDSDSWQSYLDVLDSFCQNPPEINYRPLIINGDNPVNLFIIGGDDVIPMPTVTNPGVSHQEILQKTNTLETTLEADWLYSFPSSDIIIKKDGNLDYNPLGGKSPRFFVSRLPMENGLMESSIGADLKGYFDRASAERGGIDIKHFSMVACDSAKKVANAIVEGLPVTPPDPSIGKDCYYEKVYRSPALTVAIIPDERVPESTKEYTQSLSQTDMLAFVLHGSQSPNSPYYVGQDYEDPYGGEHPIAFAPDMLTLCHAKVLVPICCWGARFINYRRERSVLLSSIYSDGLIFFGSCRSAKGTFDYGQEAGRDIDLAERLQRIFLQFLCAGYPAGEALARAKSSYLSNPGICPTCDLMTVLQFNLFGDPTLRLKPMISQVHINPNDKRNVSITLPDFKYGTFATDISVVAEFDKNDILSRVRHLVDSNLNDIRNRLDKLLPKKYHIDPANLKRIEKWNSPMVGESYCFRYQTEIKEYFWQTDVFTSETGDIQAIFSNI